MKMPFWILLGFMLPTTACAGNFGLGLARQRDCGVEKNERKAIALFLKACDSRRPEAYNSLDYMYAMECGMKKDYIKGDRTLQKSL
jgi:TPR repeat protein